jgi:hypothetical protein
MFPRWLAAAALLACAGSIPLAAAAQPAPPAKAFRTIVYDVAYSTITLRREQTSGFGKNIGTGATTSVAGSGAVDRRFTADDRGTLTVAVIAATRDGGLVVDAAFAGKTASHPPVRVAIFKDGGLSYDPNTPLSPAAIRFLPLLSRGLVAEKTIAPGEFWTAAAAAPASGNTTYRVLQVDGERATLGIDAAVSLRGPAGFDEHSEGQTVYATDLLSPLSLDLTSHVRRQISAEQNDTIDSRLVVTLVSDSFAKR